MDVLVVYYVLYYVLEPWLLNNIMRNRYVVVVGYLEIEFTGMAGIHDYSDIVRDVTTVANYSNNTSSDAVKTTKMKIIENTKRR